jgi:arylsulfatase A-like enzyme
MTKPQPNILVVSIDRLGAGYLGPYGNTWIETPSFNRLASRALLLEAALAESPDLSLAFRSYWTGRHALCPVDVSPEAALPARLQAAGWRTMLLTDEPRVAEHSLAAGFAERTPIASRATEQASEADDVSQTQMAALFAVVVESLAVEKLAPAQSPFFLWVHSRGMSGPWDAPYQFRSRFADEDDPSPPRFVEPPSRRLPESFDPDELLGCQHAYAGQVELADICLGGLLDALDESPLGESTLLIVTSPRGFPLGEHGAIGACGDALFGEVLQAPLLVRLPQGAAATRRSQALVQPADLWATLASWCGVADNSGPGFARSLLPHPAAVHPARQAVCSTFGDERSIRTPAWFLRRAQDRVQLYAKPDDRWEVNEVSNRCTEVSEQLAGVLDEQIAILERGDDISAPLPRLLVEGVD